MGMSRQFVYIVLVLVSACLGGCVHVRSSAAVDVPDVGARVVTKYRYCYVGELGVNAYNEKLRMCQRGVFSDDGVPFMMRKNDLARAVYGQSEAAHLGQFLLMGAEVRDVHLPSVRPQVVRFRRRGSRVVIDRFVILDRRVERIGKVSSSTIRIVPLSTSRRTSCTLVLRAPISGLQPCHVREFLRLLEDAAADGPVLVFDPDLARLRDEALHAQHIRHARHRDVAVRDVSSLLHPACTRDTQLKVFPMVVPEEIYKILPSLLSERIKRLLKPYTLNGDHPRPKSDYSGSDHCPSASPRS